MDDTDKVQRSLAIRILKKEEEEGALHGDVCLTCVPRYPATIFSGSYSPHKVHIYIPATCTDSVSALGTDVIISKLGCSFHSTRTKLPLLVWMTA